MPKTWTTEAHILQIWARPDGLDQIDVFHPTGCTDGCPVAHYASELREDVVRWFGRGTWRVEMEGHPPYWAGTTPMDGDAWLQHVAEYEW
jgi:hypothetical protein